VNDYLLRHPLATTHDVPQVDAERLHLAALNGRSEPLNERIARQRFEVR
jgi:hypothetical protein